MNRKTLSLLLALVLCLALFTPGALASQEIEPVTETPVPSPPPAEDGAEAPVPELTPGWHTPVSIGEDGPDWGTHDLYLDGAAEGDPDFVPSWPVPSKLIWAMDHYSGGGEHGGIDIASDEYSPVRAIADGVVVLTNNTCPHKNALDSCGWGWGNFVILRHTVNGKTFTSVYGHLSLDTITVSEGETVTEGQLIGKSGSSGNSSGFHLHLEVYRGDFYDNVSKTERSKSFQYFLNSPIALTGMTFSEHISRTSSYFADWIKSHCVLSGGEWRYNGPTATATPSPTPKPTPTPTPRPSPRPTPTPKPTPTPIPISPLIPVLVGDANGDGELNRKDRIYLARFLAGWEDYPATDRFAFTCDLNGDGEVNRKDRILLGRALSGWEGYEL